MNTEEKAKAYDEMLQRVKEFHESGNTFTKAQMEVICPELAESEDERIRKALIDIVKRETGFTGFPSQEQVLAYLEKQKINTEGDFGRGYDCGYEACLNSHGAEWFEKQKELLPIPDKFSGLKSLMLQYLQSAANRKNDTEIESDTDLWGRKILDYVWKYSDEQKEQRPVPIKPDDKHMLERIMELVEFCNDKETIWNWLCEKVKEQKPVEKQDYSGLNDLERAILRGFLAAGVENVPVTIIKETAKECLVQMKSVEWSEEDTEMYINVASSLRGYACGLENEEHKRHIKKGLDWLENRFQSLHPSWKPSEEQMDRLFSIVAALRKDYCDDMADFLANLRTDLKKLGVKEEPEYYQHFDPDC